MSKRNVIISIPLVWSVRNFIINDLNKELETKYNVYYAVPPIGANSLLNYDIAKDRIIILETGARSRFYGFIDRIIKLAHKKRKPTESDKIFKKWLDRDKKFNLKTWAIKRFYGLLSLFAYPSLIFNPLKNIWYKLLDKSIPSSLQNKVNELAPEFVLSTAIVVNWEWPLMRAAKLAGAKSYSFILSFDNLTSRGFLPLSFIDKFMVWNNTMKEELVKLFDINEQKITIVDTPQFDYHLNKSYLQSKKEVTQTFDISEDDEYILYCANHIALTPTEPELVKEILDMSFADKRLKTYKWIIRLHPMDDYDRWNELISQYPQLKLSIPWPHDDKEAIYWGHPTIEDVTLYSNILRYASIVINIFSTVAIDAALTDSPVLCVGYHPNKGSIEDLSYHDIHYSKHFKPIIESGAVKLATNLNQVHEYLYQYLDNRTLLSEERKALSLKMIPHLDGKSKERILAAIND